MKTNMSTDKIKDETMISLSMMTAMAIKIKVEKSGSMRTFMTTTITKGKRTENSMYM